MWTWLRHVAGLDNASGGWYLFWSGFGADLGAVVVVFGFLRRHNCHEPHCWRLAHTPHQFCRRHNNSNSGSTGPAAS
jgi:hypothetical protein